MVVKVLTCHEMSLIVINSSFLGNMGQICHFGAFFQFLGI